MRILTLIFLMTGSIMATTSAQNTGLIRFDFENGNAQGFIIASGAFGKFICDREFSRNYPGTPYPKPTRWYLNTLELEDGGFNDGMTGIIESPLFRLSEPKITFYVGGGAQYVTRISLCTEDGLEVMTASGDNAETMRQVTWDATAYLGQPMFIAVIDEATGGWGHITFTAFEAVGSIDLEATKIFRQHFTNRELNRKKQQEALKKMAEQLNEQRLKELTDETTLYARGEKKVFEGEYLEAIMLPVGGIAAGTIQLNGNAQLKTWQIFNNYPSIEIPENFFAIQTSTAETPALLRALQTVPASTLKPMQSLTFSGRYPFGWYTFKDSQIQAKVELEAFSPMIPMDVKNSSIPCAIFNISVSNPTSQSLDITLFSSQKNAVGHAIKTAGYSEETQLTYTTDFSSSDSLLRMHMKGTAQDDLIGDIAMTVFDATNAPVQFSGAASWTDESELTHLASKEPLFTSFEGKDAPTGVIAASFTLNPGDKRTLTFLLTWNFPIIRHGEGDWGTDGNMYTNWWKDATKTADYVHSQFNNLSKKTHLYVDSVYESNLPEWLIDRITSQMAILRSKTCFWGKDGYFGMYEGCAEFMGSCLGNCSHVWHYAQGHARLYPQIARLIREEEFAHRTADDGIRHRQRDDFDPATDGELGAILGAYREHLCSENADWLKAQWPTIKTAMEHSIKTWDANEDGVLEGAQWNTLDDALGGSTSWIGSLYLAALAACEKMGAVTGEPESVIKRWETIREKGSKTQDATLFNGEYYIQIPDPEPRKDYNNGCHIDQVLGQWWADQLDLGQLYPQAHVRSAMAALFKYNFHPTFIGFVQSPRKFVHDPDPGLQMIAWPYGDKIEDAHRIYYADEVMTGFEYSAAAAMIRAGLMREGFAVTHAVYERYDGRLRTGLTRDSASWGYSGNPFGDDECGKYYGRAMSVWSLLTASQGFIYDGPAGMLGFIPLWRPEDHCSFFTSANGYGLLRQSIDSQALCINIEMREGEVYLSQLIFTPHTSSHMALTLDGKPLTFTSQPTPDRLVLQLETPIRLAAGQTLAYEAKNPILN